MKMRVLRQGRLIALFLLVAFLACGGGGLFCPMATATPLHHSQEHSHQSPATPLNSSEDCPDQFKNSEERSRDLTYSVLPHTEITELADLYKSTYSKYFFASSVPQTSSYPLLFLLFSVFLN